MPATTDTTPAPAPNGDDGLGAIRDILGFHIRLAHGAVYRHFAETFADLGMTQKQASVLWLTDDHPHLAQADLARLMQIDRATTMAIVNRLQARGFLLRGRSPSDGRKQTLSLTDAGRAALISAKAAIAEHEDWLKSRFTSAEVASLIAMLTRIHE